MGVLGLSFLDSKGVLGLSFWDSEGVLGQVLGLSFWDTRVSFAASDLQKTVK